MHVLVTGTAGYIGSHASLRLLEDGHRVTGIDNLVRGHRAAVDILAAIGDAKGAGKGEGAFRFVECDLLDTARVRDALVGVDAVLHFAALAYVGESVSEPIRYWRANLGGTLSLLDAMDAAGTGRLVFSSTCATYGEPDASRIPIDEGCPQAPVNPYGASKLACERLIADVATARQRAGRPMGIAFLRYFNVCGSDPMGRIGEDHDPETHLIPICLEVALGQRESLTIFGEDWPTPDGTCIRDYVHVTDLIDAHVLAMDTLAPGSLRSYNVGTGRGASVREIIEACRRVTGRAITARAGARREGDPPALVNAPDRIRRELGWQARRASLETMVEDAWRWRLAHPKGYRTARG